MIFNSRFFNFIIQLIKMIKSEKNNKNIKKKNKMKEFEYFVIYLMAPLILIFGLVGNLTALAVFFKGKLKKIGPVLIYKFLFVMDNVYICQILNAYLSYAFNLNVTIVSRLACKLFNYFNYIDAISPFLLVYISLERFISIGYPTKRCKLTNTRNQVIYFICVLVFCSTYTITVPFYYDLIESQNNLTDLNKTEISCEFVSYSGQLILGTLDNTIYLIAFILISVFSCFLVKVVFKSRSRAVSTLNENKRVKRDAKLALNCILMNSIFIILCMPATVVYYNPNIFSEDFLFFSTLFIFYLSYGINFYILFFFNSLFRKEAYKMICKINLKK